MNAATTLAASVQAKKGRLYAVIQVRENGRTKPVWRALGLPESANKSKVNKAYREVVQAFEQTYAEQIAQNKKPASDIPIYDYMCAYYKKIEKNIQKSTAESYRGMINGRIRRYFTARKDLTVGNITAKDIENFLRVDVRIRRSRQHRYPLPHRPAQRLQTGFQGRTD